MFKWHNQDDLFVTIVDIKMDEVDDTASSITKKKLFSCGLVEPHITCVTNICRNFDQAVIAVLYMMRFSIYMQLFLNYLVPSWKTSLPIVFLCLILFFVGNTAILILQPYERLLCGYKRTVSQCIKPIKHRLLVSTPKNLLFAVVHQQTINVMKIFWLQMAVDG